MMNRLELRLRITPDNLADGDIRNTLYEAFGYNSFLSKEEQLRKGHLAEYYDKNGKDRQ